MGSTTARSTRAKRRVVVVRKSTRGRRNVSRPTPPDKPPVDGPRAYGVTKKGKLLVARFWVYECSRLHRVAREYKAGRFYVIDMAEPDRVCARGTSDYRTREEAVKVAKKYRNTYGAYTKVKF